ncbi:MULTISPECIES: cohesin domain-containing protein [Clostridium]|uniref:cohesin domain-containing protein n=1 Tax=Clostridium TaxID=1485 RepID=UPI00189BCD96|nr:MULTISPECIES: cohesin domain-containing protein [Clostridium]MDC0801328.1 cohesin domain-containing protein [Clostridium paraputrificum]MDU1585101.1 cohesin domain-containing protein [Clostridium sp.]
MKKYKAIHKLYISFTFLILFIVNFCLGSIPTYASTTPTLSYALSSNGLVGDTIDIEVNISNINNLYGGSWDLLYDSNLLDVISIEPGSLINSKVTTNVSNKKGHAYFWFTSTGNNSPISGSGSIVKIKAKILKEGKLNLITTNKNSDFSLNNKNSLIKLSDKSGNPVSYNSDNNSFSFINGTINSYEENNPLVHYSGNWTTESLPSYSGGSSKYSNQKNATISFSFNGSGFKWYGLANEHKGIANVYVDGVKYSVDTYSSTTVNQKLFFQKTGLTRGEHTVKIEVTNTGIGKHINIDKIDIIGGSLIPIINNYEENNPLINYSGNWISESSPSYSGGSSKYSNEKDAFINFTFNGTGFRWYGLANEYKGIANVYVDGVKYSVDTYSTSTINKKLFFEKNDLPNGKHTVKIEVTKSGNGQYINIDKINILGGSLISDSTTYEENNSLIKYSGNWTSEALSSYSGGISKYSNQKWATITFSFNGTGFKWYGLANKYKGIANVYVDGVKYSVDTYSSTSVNQKLFFEKTGLTNGTHTVRIEVTGLGNGSYINIDKLDIIGGNLVPVAINTYEENNPYIYYSGSWNTESMNSYSAGVSKYSNQKGASINFTFNGTGFRWYGLANIHKGVANVYVDGTKYSVNTYSSTTINNKLFFEKNGLQNGKHTVKIEVSDTTPGKYINIDNIDIINGSILSDTKTYEEDDSLIKYSGNWISESLSSYSGGKSKYSNQKGGTITFSFNGTGFKWYGLANKYKGIANVYVDGVKYSVNTYSASTVNQKLFFEKTGLTNDTHTVRIEVTGMGNGSYINIDKLDIIGGNLIPVAINTYEENNSLIKYSGNWSSEASTSYSGGNSKFSNKKGDFISFSFKGTGFRWYGLANKYKGIANIYVDGVKYSVDTYSASTVNQKLFFEKTGLSNDRHTVKIEVANTGSNSYVNIDNIDIINGTLIN